MKLRSLLSLSAIFGTLLVAACAADNTDIGATEVDAGVVEDAAPPPIVDAGAKDTAPPPKKDAGMCVSKCAADTDCQNSCPSVASGINCCDTATGACYVAAQSSCPVPQPDAGSTAPY